MNNDILTILSDAFMETKLENLLKEDAKYQKLKSEEQKFLIKLRVAIDEEVEELLNDFFLKASRTTEIVNTLSYQQGMKDLTSLLGSLSGREGLRWIEQYMKNSAK